MDCLGDIEEEGAQSRETKAPLPCRCDNEDNRHDDTYHPGQQTDAMQTD